jgi:hypothetical protein
MLTQITHILPQVLIFLLFIGGTSMLVVDEIREIYAVVTKR